MSTLEYDVPSLCRLLTSLGVQSRDMDIEAALKRRRAIASGEIWASEIPFHIVLGSDATKKVKLFLGSGQDASNIERLREHGVTHIVNVADDVENFHPEQFVYCNLDVTDFGGDLGISRVFDRAAEFVRENALTSVSESTFLVHCANGSNRSSTVVIALLMILQGLDLKNAFNTVKNAHQKTAPFMDNRKQLMDFERRLFPGRAEADYCPL